MLFRPLPLLPLPSGLPDPLQEKSRSPAPDTSSKGVLPRLKHMKEVRPFEGIVTTECSSRLNEQRRLSIWNAGPTRCGILTKLIVAARCRKLVRDLVY